MKNIFVELSKSKTFEDAKKFALMCADETGYEHVVFKDNTIAPDHWVEKNPEVAEQIIYSTLV